MRANRNSHLAPEPQALARSGCWMTSSSYVKCRPSLVTRVIEVLVSLETASMLAMAAVCIGESVCWYIPKARVRWSGSLREMIEGDCVGMVEAMETVAERLKVIGPERLSQRSDEQDRYLGEQVSFSSCQSQTFRRRACCGRLGPRIWVAPPEKTHNDQPCQHTRAMQRSTTQER